MQQTTYQEERFKTEQVLAIKVPCEKEMTSENFIMHLLQLDMLKVFHTMNRKKRFEILETILEPDNIKKYLTNHFTNISTHQLEYY